MEQEAVSSRVEQLQAVDLPSALAGLLKQAQTLLKPPSRGAAAAASAAAVPAAAKHSLVGGILLLLERAARLASQQRDPKIVKDAVAQLAAALQQQPWLWELVLRKHLPAVLQHPAAAQLCVEALARLPGGEQARAFRLWREQLAAQQLAGAAPRGLAAALLAQLQRSFQAGSAMLPLLPELGAGADEGDAVAAEQAAAGAAAAAEADVHVELREALPHLLHLLLLITCGAGGAAATCSQDGSGGGVGAAAGPSTAGAPSLSSVQSAAADLPSGSSDGPAGTTAVAAGAAAGAAGGSSRQRDAVLQHSVLLVSRLSDPDALHGMLGAITQRTRRGSDSDAGSDGEAGLPRRQAEAARAGVRGQALSRRGVERVRTALALIEVCLDGMLALPPLAAAVHLQLHSKGSSTGGGQKPGLAVAGAAAAGAQGPAGSAAGDPAGGEAAAAEAEQAAAELRHTAGAMLGMHRELSRLLASSQQAAAAAGGKSQRRRPAPQLLSLPACQRLLDLLAAVQPPVAAAGAAAATQGAGSSQPPLGRAGRPQGAVQQKGLSQEPPALLLVPPQLAVQGLELVRQAVEVSGSGGGSRQAEGCAADWRCDMTQRVAAIYAACYQAMWGGKVLRSAEAYQLLLSAARLRMLLRTGGADGLAGGAVGDGADDEAAAEAALLTHNAVGGRRRRQLSGAHDLPRLGVGTAAAAAAASAPPPAKRLKPDPAASGSDAGGSAVAQLLQLFEAPQQEQAAAVEQQEPEQQPEPPQQPAKLIRKRIVPQQIAPAPQAAQQRQALCDAAPGDTSGTAAAAEQLELEQSSGGGARLAAERSSAEQQHAAQPGGELGQGRVTISKTATMTDEEQEALWEAYIADKEFLAEMLGDSEYQQWYDEAAHPLRRQQRRPGGLEAAWAAVLGGASAGSLVQRQLPRTLLEASGSMPWDAAAAACLRLLYALLASAADGGSASASGSAVLLQQRQELLRHAFPAELRGAGTRAAMRICHVWSGALFRMCAAAAATWPACGTLVLLTAQLTGLVEGQDYLQESQAEVELARRAASRQGREEQGGASCRLVAPPLLEAYAAVLAELLPAVQAEEAANAAQGFPDRTPRDWQRQQMLGTLGAPMVAQLMRLPPPLQHMLGPGCAPLLRLEAAAGGSRQCAALLWMLARQQLAGGGGSGCAGAVRFPADSPDWLQGEALWLLADDDGPSHGHVLLLRPLRQVQQAAAAELLSLLRQQLGVELGGAAGGVSAVALEGLSAEELLPAVDACGAAMHALLLEQQWRQQREEKQQQHGGESDAEDSEAEGEEDQEQEPLLLSSAAAVAGLGALAAALCQIGAAAAGEVAAAVDAAAAALHSTQQRSVDGSEGFTAVQAAAGALALCNQLVEPADQLLQAGCLPPPAAQQLDAACEALDGQLRAIEQLERLLPPAHPLLAAVAAAMEAAPRLWQPWGEQSSEEEEGEEEEEEEEEEGNGGAAAQQQAGGSRQQHRSGDKVAESNARRRRRRRRLGDVRNPALRAMLAEEGGGAALDADDLSDLEDFIVCNPERDYDSFYRHHFCHVRGSDSEEELEGEEEEGRQQQRAGAAEGGGAGDDSKGGSGSRRRRRRRETRRRRKGSTDGKQAGAGTG